VRAGLDPSSGAPSFASARSTAAGASSARSSTSARATTRIPSRAGSASAAFSVAVPAFRTARLMETACVTGPARASEPETAATARSSVRRAPPRRASRARP
jgi:hypothetical protein